MSQLKLRSVVVWKLWLSLVTTASFCYMARKGDSELPSDNAG